MEEVKYGLISHNGALIENLISNIILGTNFVECVKC